MKTKTKAGLISTVILSVGVLVGCSNKGTLVQTDEYSFSEKVEFKNDKTFIINETKLEADKKFKEEKKEELRKINESKKAVAILVEEERKERERLELAEKMKKEAILKKEYEDKLKQKILSKDKTKNQVVSRGKEYQGGSYMSTEATHYSLGNTGGDVPACGVINLQQTGTHYQGKRIVAANTSKYPCGSILQITSKLGTEQAIVMDTGGFLKSKPNNIDILVRSEKEAYSLGRYQIKFKVIRLGW